MRATVGILGILGLTVAVASAQAPPSAHPPQRRATLLPPVAIHPSELPGVARAAAEELTPSMTPVARPGSPAVATAPGWLSGTDSNVRPAAGTGGHQSPVRHAAPRTASANDASSMLSRGLEKLKGSKGARPDDRSPGQLPPGVAAVTANANTPFRGTGSNGAPVDAGPPAYRWYGWGSVTPGANPYAPTGQYPPASANWHSITGATPGAFPVPVTHPSHVSAGTEPPVYVPVHGQRVAPIWNNHSSNMPAHGFVRGAESITHVSPPERAHQHVPPRVTPTPTITQPPPIVLPTIAPTPIIVPGTTDQEPPIRPIGTGGREEPLPVLTPQESAASSLPSSGPSPLPVSVTDEKSGWLPTNESKPSGEWAPADRRPQSQTAPSPANGRHRGAQQIARGQIEEARPDAAVELIRNLCQGRATAVDVRRTGGEKIRVTFDCRTAAAAQQLVKEICARTELAPLQIEFSVVVKLTSHLGVKRGPLFTPRLLVHSHQAIAEAPT